jgi:hypothetical protein
MSLLEVGISQVPILVIGHILIPNNKVRCPTSDSKQQQDYQRFHQVQEE